METNHEIELARQYVEQTDMNVLLLGKAGTGKTTFLRSVVDSRVKRAIVVAPTGVAAINAGGVTLHSFFQLPLAPFVPGTTFKQSDKKQFNVNRTKQRIIRSLDLLIIDEISMVRADLLDAVDATLRQQRRNDRPFGGVQLLMIGDLAQLAPVVKEGERELLSRYYPSPYFYESKALAKTRYVSIELTHVYRQRDPEFVALLQQIRTGRPDADALRLLNQRYKPGFSPRDDEGYIRLTTHNRQADAYNEERLAALSTPMFTFDAVVKGNFPEQLYPVDCRLRLKKGAQVMFCKNDSSPQHLYYNGKVGQVSHIDGETIVVRCPGDSSDITLSREMWENTRYTLNEKNKEIEEEVEGTFAQYPLRYAWAITIHKSQGLTFDRCIVDAARAFASGQVYVALSRCRSLGGLVLSSPLAAHSVISDFGVERFVSQQQEAAAQVEQSLPMLRLNYIRRLLDELFDFSEIQGELRRLTNLMEEKLYSVYPQIVRAMRDADRAIGRDLVEVAARFRLQYTQLISEGNSARLTERVRKACGYYRDAFKKIMLPVAGLMDVESDSQAIQSRIDDYRAALLLLGHIKTRLLDHFAEEDFSARDFLHTKAVASIEDPKKKLEKPKKDKKKSAKDDSSADDIENKVLFEELRQWRKERAEADALPVYVIAGQRVLAEIAAKLPTTMAELLAIKGMGKAKVALYGKDILRVVESYLAAQDD